MGGDGDENEAPLEIYHENHLDYQENQEEVNPNKEEQTIFQQPVKL